MKQLIENLLRFRGTAIQITELLAKSAGLRENILEQCDCAGLKPDKDGKYEFLLGNVLWSIGRSKDGKDVNVTYRDLPVIKELIIQEESTDGNG